MSFTAIDTSHRPTLLRNRNFVLLWLAESIGMFGGGLTTIAASLLVYRLTNSALSVGLMLAATQLPGLLFSLGAGVLADSLDAKRILAITEVSYALLIVLVPILAPANILWLYVLMFAITTTQQFCNPVTETLVPELVAEERLPHANVWMEIGSVGASAIGFATAGFLAANLSLDWAFYIDGFTAIVALACIMLIPLPKRHTLPNSGTIRTRAAPHAMLRNLRKTLAEGVHFVVRTPAMRAFFIAHVPLLIGTGIFYSLLLPFAKRALNASDLDFSLLEGIVLAGSVCGSLLMGKLADRLHTGQWLALLIGGYALGIAVFASLTSIAAAIMCHFFISAVDAMLTVVRKLVFQRNTPRGMRGRVAATYFMVLNTLMLVPSLGAGVADVVDVRLLMLMAAALAGLSMFAAMLLPGLRQSLAEWRRMLAMLRTAPQAPALGLGRAALLSDLQALVLHLPALNTLDHATLQELVSTARVFDVPPGSAIVRKGEQSDAAYFLLDGQTVAWSDSQAATWLEVHAPGDFFGEMAAMLRTPRTATVLADSPSRVLQVPAATLRRLMESPTIRALLVAKLHERATRLNLADVPLLAQWTAPNLEALRAETAQA